MGEQRIHTARSKMNAREVDRFLVFCTTLGGSIVWRSAVKVVGSDVNEDDALGPRGTPEREPVAVGGVTSVGGPIEAGTDSERE